MLSACAFATLLFHPSSVFAAVIVNPWLRRILMGLASSPLICPGCQGENAPDAVFCANLECGKALGEFKYVREELQSKTRWHETLAEKVSSFISNPHFIVVHAFWFVLRVAVNTGLLAVWRSFDAYPFGLLGILLSIETIFITGFLLISQNRQNTQADKRAELDYEVNVEPIARAKS